MKSIAKILILSGSFLILAGCGKKSDPAADTTQNTPGQEAPALGDMGQTTTGAADASYTGAYNAGSTVEPARPAGNRSHTIKKGDTLWSLAKSYYGDGKKYQLIVDANPGLTPQTLKVGQSITIP